MLKKFEVRITETLSHTAWVKAKDRYEAEQIISNDWRNCKYVLDSDNFIGVEFEACEVGKWNIEDVQNVRPDLSDEQAMEVLKKVEDVDAHDAEMGITWTTLVLCAQTLFPYNANLLTQNM